MLDFLRFLEALKLGNSEGSVFFVLTQVVAFQIFWEKPQVSKRKLSICRVI